MFRQYFISHNAALCYTETSWSFIVREMNWVICKVLSIFFFLNLCNIIYSCSYTLLFSSHHLKRTLANKSEGSRCIFFGKDKHVCYLLEPRMKYTDQINLLDLLL